MRSLKVLLLAAGLVLSGTHIASAHAELLKSFPVANSTLTKAPKYVQLEFGEALTTLNTKQANLISVFRGTTEKIATSKISINKRFARVEISQELKPGSYLVKYRVVSADGHVLVSQFKFKLS